MLKKPESHQQELELVSIEALVPSTHLLRKVDGAVDFGFIRDRVKHLYSEDNGRPALDPVVLFKLQLPLRTNSIQIAQQQKLEQQHRVQPRTTVILAVKMLHPIPDKKSTAPSTFRNKCVEGTSASIDTSSNSCCCNSGFFSMNTNYKRLP